MHKLEKFTRESLDFDKRLFFVFLCLFTFVLLLIKKNFIELEIAAFEVLEQDGDLGVFHFIKTLQNFSIPIIYLWKFTIIAFVIWIGCFMFGYKVAYVKLWQVVMIAESVFFFPEILKIFYFLFMVTDPDYFEVRAFYPFSIMNLFDYQITSKAWHYPLKALNIFELIYWALLIYGIKLASRKRLEISALIVIFSYIFFFFVWLGFYVVVYK